MLDQSFSAANFLKIVDIENRKGNYLEGKFFPEVKGLNDMIQSYKKKRHCLKEQKSRYTDDDFQNRMNDLLSNLEALNEKKERKLLGELGKISEKIDSKNFSFNIREVDAGISKKVFSAERSAPTFFALKQLQYNIRRLYKVRQANRHQIVCQLRELLGDGFPKYIIRTDISSFYESIPRTKLLKKLSDDPLLTLSSQRLIQKILYEYGKKTGSDVGIPRGIGISAYLAELYMRDIDRTIRDYPGVVFYARYVDDIFVIVCPPPNTGIEPFYQELTKVLKKHELKENEKKTKKFKVEDNTSETIQYLGYKFEITCGSVCLTMTNKKMNRYKQRIDLTFSAYKKKSMKSEKKARAILERRIRFLTGNTRLVNSKKNAVSGIFFSNSLLTDKSDLDGLDKYLKAKIARLSNNRLKNRLLSHSFKQGFETRRYHKFSAKELSQIVKVWKHVS